MLSNNHNLANFTNNSFNNSYNTSIFDYRNQFYNSKLQLKPFLNYHSNWTEEEINGLALELANNMTSDRNSMPPLTWHTWEVYYRNLSLSTPQRGNNNKAINSSIWKAWLPEIRGLFAFSKRQVDNTTPPAKRGPLQLKLYPLARLIAAPLTAV